MHLVFDDLKGTFNYYFDQTAIVAKLDLKYLKG